MQTRPAKYLRRGRGVGFIYVVIPTDGWIRRKSVSTASGGPSSVHPAAADDASGNDDGDGATMDVAPLGTVESVQAGVVGEIRPEPKTTYRLATTVRGLQIRLRSKTRSRIRSRSRSRSITRSRSHEC